MFSVIELLINIEPLMFEHLLVKYSLMKPIKSLQQLSTRIYLSIYVVTMSLFPADGVADPMQDDLPGPPKVVFPLGSDP